MDYKMIFAFGLMHMSILVEVRNALVTINKNENRG